MALFEVDMDASGILGEVRSIGTSVPRNAVRAVNKTLDRQRARAARLIQSQINLPASYLSPSQGRLSVTRRATIAKPEGAITARGRPVSLARFVSGRPAFNKGGVTVRVKPGQASFLRKAFLIRLRRGTDSIDTAFNAGLAIRLRPGERISSKLAQVQVAKGLYLLYGPSVQQVFLDNAGDGVAKDISNETARRLEIEFLRLMDL